MSLKNRICKKIPHQDHIFDLPVLQIQSLKCSQVISDKLQDQLVIVCRSLFEFFETFTDTHASHLETLRRYKCVLVKQRHLQSASTHVQDRRSLLDHFFESGFLCRNRFVAKEMLLCIAEDFNPDSGAAINLFLYDQRIYHLTKRTGRTGTIIRNSELLHHLAEIVEDHTDRIHDLRLETS